MRASKMQVLRKLVLPDAIPIIMAGERLALTAALSGALVAEFIQRSVVMHRGHRCPRSRLFGVPQREFACDEKDLDAR